MVAAARATINLFNQFITDSWSLFYFTSVRARFLNPRANR